MRSNRSKPPLFVHSCIVFCIFVVSGCRNFEFGTQVEAASPSLQMTNHPWKGCAYVTWPT